MSLFKNPFNAESRLTCACGRHASAAEHEAAARDAEAPLGPRPARRP